MSKFTVAYFILIVVSAYFLGAVIVDGTGLISELALFICIFVSLVKFLKWLKRDIER